MAYTTIDNPELYFQTKIYTGDGNDDRDIVFDVTDTSMQPNMIWSARRDSGDNISLYDSVRGDGKEFRTAETGAEYARSDNIQALNSNGFQVGTDGQVNADGGTYVSWAWKESATAGFGIETWTGDGNTNRDVAHNMSATPNVAIIKRRDSANSWIVYHHANTSAPLTDYLYLDTTDATSDASGAWIGVDGTNVELVQVFSATNTNTATYAGYFFAEKQGFSKFGSYTGNGNADGEFIYLGFKPAWFLCKNTQDAGDNWIVHDNKRDTFNVTDAGLAPNTASAEFTDVDMDFLSNGVKMRNNTGRANSAKTFIYMAFAESPFVNSNGVPNNAR